MPTSTPPYAKRRQAKPLRMSEEEFVEWCTPDIRAEWVDGEVVMMNAVALDHADMFAFIFALLHGFAEAHDLGKVLNEPYQIRLPGQRRRRSPDIFFLAASPVKLLEKMQLNGAPDLIVEIVSPENQSTDRRVEFLEYETAGVREYWLVDSTSRSFEAYSLQSNGTYEPINPTVDGVVHSVVLPGLSFRNQWVWQQKLPKVAPLLAQMTEIHKKRPSTRKPRSSDNWSR